MRVTDEQGMMRENVEIAVEVRMKREFQRRKVLLSDAGERKERE